MTVDAAVGSRSSERGVVLVVHVMLFDEDDEKEMNFTFVKPLWTRKKACECFGPLVKLHW